MAFRHEVLHIRRQKQRLIDVPRPKILAHRPMLNQTRPDLNSDYPDKLLAALRAWQTDVAIVDDLTTAPGIPEATVEMLHLLDDSLHVLLPEGHPLADRPYATLRELSEEKWALDTASITYSNVIVKACRDTGFDPVINGHCHGFEVVRALIEAGCSISIIPGLRGRDYVGKLCLKEIRPTIARKIFVAYRRGEKRNPAIAACISELQTVVSSLPSASWLVSADRVVQTLAD
uniref:LysR substrate-binding domain-containing protein n=2 Tax=Bradyrhizobium septentrionale TaxID=1404411 RepID=A0A973W5Y7_9BRAD